MIPVDTFEELQIPLKVLVTDIQSGEGFIHESGNLKEAIVQSSSIPGFFEPTHRDERILVDGGVTAPILFIILKLTNVVLAVDITNYSVTPLNNPNMIEIVRRSDIITGLNLRKRIARC